MVRPHVAGNSMGGAIALELARLRQVASVTAFSPAGFWTPAEAVATLDDAWAAPAFASANGCPARGT